MYLEHLCDNASNNISRASYIFVDLLEQLLNGNVQQALALAHADHLHQKG